MIKKLLLLASVAVLFQFCNNNQVIEKEKLTAVYVDLLIAQDTLHGHKENYFNEKQRVFTRHKVTQKEYELTIESFGNDKEKWNEFFENSLVLVDSLKKQN